MFICDLCGCLTESKEKCNKEVVETRTKVYDNGFATTTGWEIVREAKACTGCHDERRKRST